jgi:hypothetical protein
MIKFLIILFIFLSKFSLNTFGYVKDNFDGVLTHEVLLEWGFDTIETTFMDISESGTLSIESGAFK